MIRIGVDFGGTKIEAAALNDAGRLAARIRAPNPGRYHESLDAIRRLVGEVEREAGVSGASLGVAMPGSISPATGRVRNANSTWLNGTLFHQDLTTALNRPVRIENDANCFALSEAIDGAGEGQSVVFGAILGTGCGGGVVVNGAPIAGRNQIAGEWGHIPLPWPTQAEADAHDCWCGRSNCVETWISGPSFARDYAEHAGRTRTAAEIMDAVRSGEADAGAAFDRYVDRLGRALAVICNLIDPDVIVCGGGMSNSPEIYPRVGAAIEKFVFSDVFTTSIMPARHGDSSGVRGAAWLWPNL